MSKAYNYRVDALKLFLLGTVPPWVDNDYLWVSLHTADPVAGNQSTYEVSYTGYARQKINRAAGAWTTITSSGARNTSAVTFPAPSGGAGDEVWYVGLGLDETGAGTLMVSSNVLDPVYLIAISEPIVVPIEGLLLRDT